eukprot:Opistho-1_new@75164
MVLRRPLERKAGSRQQERDLVIRGGFMSLLVGHPAPFFTAKAVIQGNIAQQFSLKDLLGRYVFFFFYPLDFTFVCPTELHAFQEKLGEFEKRNAQVVGCSVDSWFSHLAWLQTPR